jgi:hypothetical protein
MHVLIERRNTEKWEDFLLENTIAPAFKHVTKIHYECSATEVTNQVMQIVPQKGMKKVTNL